jgi:hypothetical protein
VCVRVCACVCVIHTYIHARGKYRHAVAAALRQSDARKYLIHYLVYRRAGLRVRMQHLPDAPSEALLLHLDCVYK